MSAPADDRFFERLRAIATLAAAPCLTHFLTNCAVQSAPGPVARPPEINVGTPQAPEASSPVPSADSEPSKPAQPSLDPAAFSDIPCGPGGAPQLASIRASRGFDFLELRSALQGSAPGDHSVVASTGQPCAQMSDAACRKALASLVVESGFVESCVQLCSYQYLVGTEGAQVFQVSSRSELEQFLGPIDALVEAQLITQAHDYNSECGSASQGEQRTSGYQEVGDGFRLLTTRLTGHCPMERTRYIVAVSRDARVEQLWQEVLPSEGSICIGRRQRTGFGGSSSGRERGPNENAPAAHFARMAALEAESVFAFEALAGELRRHGAPRTLSEAALSAAADEVRHAHITGELARVFGADPDVAEPAVPRRLALYELALDNAIEGCVRETLGAVFALYQAGRARDARVRAILRSIAQDELEHGRLAWRIARWSLPRLTSNQRARLARSVRQAFASLSRELAADPRQELQQSAGLPTAATASAMLAAFERVAAPRLGVA